MEDCLRSAELQLCTKPRTAPCRAGALRSWALRRRIGTTNKRTIPLTPAPLRFIGANWLNRKPQLNQQSISPRIQSGMGLELLNS